jgi:hypothetical protein
MERVVRVWTAVATQDGDIAEAVRAHATAFISANSSQAELTGAFTSLHSALDRPKDDMLPLLEAHFGLGLLNAPGIGDMSARLRDEDFTEETYVDPAEARVERVREWRLAAVRGLSSISLAPADEFLIFVERPVLIFGISDTPKVSTWFVLSASVNFWTQGGASLLLAFSGSLTTLRVNQKLDFFGQ